MMMDQGIATEAELKAADAAAKADVDAAIAFARSSPYPKPEEALENVFV
jgi:TPP-dependent pyruvate/acetoin dehydrogenase alpha subunit